MTRLILAALVAIWGSVAAAAVTYDEDTNALTVSGSTTAYMLTQMRTAFLEHDVDTIFMSGPGGDYRAGLAIGRLIRAEGARVIIPRGVYCASACAMSAMAAERLYIDGEAIFHRPYTQGVPTGATIEEITAFFGDVFLEMAAYMVEMGYTIDLARRIVTDTGRCTWLVADADHGLDDMFIDERCGPPPPTAPPASGYRPS